MKKTILLSIIAASLMADISIAEFKMKNPVMSAENLSVEHGGTKSMIDAYSDGVGVVVVGDYATLDNTPVNTLVYKYGQDAKKASASLPDYVLGLSSASAKDKALAQKIKNNLAASTYVKDGDACDDGEPTTINDIYVNGVCQGSSALNRVDIVNSNFITGSTWSKGDWENIGAFASGAGLNWCNAEGLSYTVEFIDPKSITTLIIDNPADGYDFHGLKFYKLYYSDDGINYNSAYSVPERAPQSGISNINTGFHGSHKFWRVTGGGSFRPTYITSLGKCQGGFYADFKGF